MVNSMDIWIHLLLQKINFPVCLKISIFKMIYKRKSPANQRPLKYMLTPLDRRPRSLCLCNYVRSSKLLIRMVYASFTNKNQALTVMYPTVWSHIWLVAIQLACQSPALQRVQGFLVRVRGSQFLAHGLIPHFDWQQLNMPNIVMATEKSY